MRATLLAAAAVAFGTASGAPAQSLSEVLADLDATLLAGEALPPDFLLALAPLPPAERLLAVAHARRTGLLTGAALPLDRLLAREDRP